MAETKTVDGRAPQPSVLVRTVQKEQAAAPKLDISELLTSLKGIEEKLADMGSSLAEMKSNLPLFIDAVNRMSGHLEMVGFQIAKKEFPQAKVTHALTLEPTKVNVQPGRVQVEHPITLQASELKVKWLVIALIMTGIINSLSILGLHFLTH